MKHRIGYNKLNRKASHRKALINNMVTSLFKHERITTTIAKAKEVRRTAEKMVTRAKIDNVHNRRLISKRIKDKAVLNKLFTEISVRFKERPGGYTRVLRIGNRNNDAAEMSILELVDKVVEVKKKPKKTAPEEAAKASESTDEEIVAENIDESIEETKEQEEKAAVETVEEETVEEEAVEEEVSEAVASEENSSAAEEGSVDEQPIEEKDEEPAADEQSEAKNE